MAVSPLRWTTHRRMSAVLAGVAATALAVAGCSGGGSSGGGGSNSNGSGGSATLTMASSSPWTTWQYNPWSTSMPGAAAGFVVLPLAVQKWPSLTDYEPQLATSWSAKGNTFTVNLRSGVKWQNGSPVTSTDVIDTLYLNGIAGSAIWNDISAVAAPSSTQVVFTARPGVPLSSLQSDVFGGLTPYPSSVWGKYVTPALKSDVVAYYNQSQKNPDAAGKSAQFKRMGTAFQKLAKVAPKTLVGDGPYKLTKATSQTMKLVKWDGFYDAKHITIGTIDYLGLQQPQVNEALLNGRADFSSGWLYMTPVIIDRWQHTSGANLLTVPGTFQGQIVFNIHQYPFNITKVRQALAYAIPLKKMDELAWGTHDAHAIAPDIPDGLVPQVEANFLSKDQISGLNTYETDTGKAAKLLQEAGFRKSNGSWMMPNGKPFTINLTINASWTDQVAAFKVASSGLSDFGIKTPLTTVESTTYLANLHNGNFQVSAFCCTGGSPNPLLDFSQSPMGSSENFTASGANKGQRGIGFGPVADVPGIGKVNVPQTLDQQTSRVGPGPKMKSLAYAWAKFVNDQVPYLEYCDFANQIAYSDKNFAFPSTSDSMWSQIGNGNYAMVIGQERGTIHPK